MSELIDPLDEELAAERAIAEQQLRGELQVDYQEFVSLMQKHAPLASVAQLEEILTPGSRAAMQPYKLKEKLERGIGEIERKMEGLQRQVDKDNRDDELDQDSHRAAKQRIYNSINRGSTNGTTATELSDAYREKYVPLERTASQAEYARLEAEKAEVQEDIALLAHFDELISKNYSRMASATKAEKQEYSADDSKRIIAQSGQSFASRMANVLKFW